MEKNKGVEFHQPCLKNKTQFNWRTVTYDNRTELVKSQEWITWPIGKKGLLVHTSIQLNHKNYCLIGEKCTIESNVILYLCA